MKNDAGLQIGSADEGEGRLFVIEGGHLVLCGGNINMLGDMGNISYCPIPEVQLERIQMSKTELLAKIVNR